MAVSAHAQQNTDQKWLKTWLNCHNIRSYTKSDPGNSISGSNFNPEVKKWSFLHMHSKEMAKMELKPLLDCKNFKSLV